MKTIRASTNRRDFLKIGTLTSLAAFAPFSLSQASTVFKPNETPVTDPGIHFSGDRLDTSADYSIKQLMEANEHLDILSDVYGQGGTTKRMLERFAELTGKEKAIFFPTGTMANEVALKILSGENTKVLVPENSHVYRDEADAAAAVHGKRLIPVGKGKDFYDLNDLKDTIGYYDNGEVFKSGIGAILVECPVRRADGVAVPLKTIVELSNYSREKGYKLHLDGARLLIASAYTGVSAADYSRYFDTVYISLYKYLNAPFGAVLCGDAEVIDKMEHQIKILGGATFQTWVATAPALYFLDGFEERWKDVIDTSAKLFTELNKLDGIEITSIANGTNVFNLSLGEGIDPFQFAQTLYRDHNILIRRPNEDGLLKLQANESFFLASIPFVYHAWKKSIETCRKGG